MKLWVIFITTTIYDNIPHLFSTPFFFSYLKDQLLEIDDKIKFVVPIMLDKVAVEMGPLEWILYPSTAFQEPRKP